MKVGRLLVWVCVCECECQLLCVCVYVCVCVSAYACKLLGVCARVSCRAMIDEVGTGEVYGGD